MGQKKYYPDVPANPDFPAMEEQVLSFWQSDDLFRRSVKSNPAKKAGKNNEFIFYDGPPFANGLPHYGHLLTGYVKDVFARYQTMRGKRVERRFGWDCHGLPAEMGSEKELGISGRQAIQNFGIDKFNEHCRSSVMKYTGEWEYYVNRQARWVDFENDYKTMDRDFMESVLWAFKQLFDKGLIYEAYRVMPYSWAAETPLSNFETKLDNSYRERVDKSVYVAFELKEKPEGAPDGCDSYKVIAWTTTPWTLPSNLALAASKEIDYICIYQNKVCYLLSKNSYETKFKNKDFLIDSVYVRGEVNTDEIAERVSSEHGILSGANLIGLQYEPLFPYFADHPNAFRILDGSDFVTDADGTGIVHMAPGFGEDDQRVCEANGISLVVPVDEKGRYTDEIYDLPSSSGASHATGDLSKRSSTSRDEAEDDVLPPLSLKGLNVVAQVEGARADEPYKEEQLKKYGLANLRIISWLKETGKLISQEDYPHNYPHCWRTDTPLIYRALPSWYVAVTKFRDRAVELNRQINWIPSHIRDGQMEHMLSTAPDWSISRNRFWGTPIPVWRSDNPNNPNLYVFGSIEELQEFFKPSSSGASHATGDLSKRSPTSRGEAEDDEFKITDLHRPYIDELTKPDPLDSQYTIRRVSDVFDCWFESGSMPFAQVHYPFENKDWFEGHFPADFITEYVGQTRGWFNTLIMLSTALFDRPPFKNCICHGVVLDAETGEKYSKRLKNYKDPKEVMDQFGADALRWLMMASPVMRGADISVDPDGKFIRDAVRLYIKPIWNAYSFYTLYANADGIKGELLYKRGEDGRDQWRAPQAPMDRYIITKLADALVEATQALDNFETPAACNAVTAFFEDLNNWYIRRSKPRFWKQGHDKDKQTAYDTLYTCLHVMCRVVAPLLPFASEQIFAGLTNGGMLEDEHSVHLARFPVFENISQVADEQIRDDMDRIKDICNAALSVRNARNLRVRLPLASLTVVSRGEGFPQEFADIIRDEVNVKDVQTSSQLDDFATLKLKILFPKVGARLGTKMKEVAAAAKKGEWQKHGDSTISLADEVLTPDEFDLTLDPKPDVKDSAQALSSNDALVVLDTKVTPELEAEGLARDMVRLIQQARKDAGLDVSDRISLSLSVPQKVEQAITAHQQYVSQQTLASKLSFGAEAKGTFITDGKLEDATVSIAVTKAA